MVTPNDPILVVSAKPCQSAQTRKKIASKRNANSIDSSSIQFGHKSIALYAKKLYLTSSIIYIFIFTIFGYFYSFYFIL